MTIIGSIIKISNPKKSSIGGGSISNNNFISLYSSNTKTCESNSGSGLFGANNLLGGLLGSLGGNNNKQVVYHPAVSATGETIYIHSVCGCE